MAKAAVVYACAECGYSAGRWFGRCPGCGSFGTLAEEAPEPAGKAAARPPLRLVGVEADEAERIPTRVPQLHRVPGGGGLPPSPLPRGGGARGGESTPLVSGAQ